MDSKTRKSLNRMWRGRSHREGGKSLVVLRAKLHENNRSE